MMQCREILNSVYPLLYGTSDVAEKANHPNLKLYRGNQLMRAHLDTQCELYANIDITS